MGEVERYVPVRKSRVMENLQKLHPFLLKERSERGSDSHFVIFFFRSRPDQSQRYYAGGGGESLAAAKFAITPALSYSR